MNDAAIEDLLHESLAEHEGAHAAAALLLGLDFGDLSAPLLTIAEIENGDPASAAGYVQIRPPDIADRDAVRRFAIAIGAAHVNDPRWPPNQSTPVDPVYSDEASWNACVKTLALGPAEHDELWNDVRAFCGSPEYRRAQSLVATLAKGCGRLTAAQLHDIKHSLTERTAMDTKRLNVTDVEVGEGELLALASTWDVDLVNDRVMPGAYAQAVAKIKAGERLPLIWGHDASGSPLNWVGEVIDAEETAAGLQVHARFDLDDDAGRKAYNLVKRGSIKALSIGYRVLEKRNASGGITELLKIELHEVSLVLTPANPGARILAIKTDTPAAPTLEELKAKSREIERDLGLEDPAITATRDEWRNSITAALRATTPAPRAAPAETLREKSQRVAREHAPVQIATFEC